MSFMRFVVTELVRFFVVWKLVLTMKRLKETLTLPWVGRQSSPPLHDLHALRGYQACTALHHEEHEVDEGDPNLPLGAETGLSFKRFMPFMVTKLVRLFTVSFMVDSLVWRLPKPFMVRSGRSRSSVD